MDAAAERGSRASGSGQTQREGQCAHGALRTLAPCIDASAARLACSADVECVCLICDAQLFILPSPHASTTLACAVLVGRSQSSPPLLPHFSSVFQRCLVLLPAAASCLAVVLAVVSAAVTAVGAAAAVEASAATAADEAAAEEDSEEDSADATRSHTPTTARHS